jgi:hypothetical protein
MKRCALVGALVACIAQGSNALALTKCLPEPPGAGGYDEFLAGEMHRRSTGTLLFTYAVTPSFFTEHGFVLTRSGSRILLTAVTFTESVWGRSWIEVKPGYFEVRFSSDKVRAQAKQVELDADVARSLIDLLQVELAASQRREPRIGVDGTSFTLTSADGKCAATWSPQPNTHDAVVTAVLDKFHSSVKHPSAAVRKDLHNRQIQVWKAAPRL